MYSYFIPKKYSILLSIYRKSVMKLCNFLFFCNFFACARSIYKLFGLETEHLFYVALWEKCHGKEVCTLSEEDVVSSICSYEVNALDFTYSCISLYSSHGINLLLGGSIDRKIDANEEIQVRSQNYPLQITKRARPMTYTCEFTNYGEMQENELFLRLQRILLAEKSHLGIDIDGNRHLSLVRKEDVALNGQDNCQTVAFKEKVTIYYRQCGRSFGDETVQGSVWITMRTNTALRVKCYTHHTIVMTQGKYGRRLYCDHVTEMLCL